MTNKSENKIPKSYYYSVEGVLDKEGNLRKFSIPSFGRDLDDEFDLEGISNTAALWYYLEYDEYKDVAKWPLNFYFYKVLKTPPVKVEMNLSFSPCFTSTPKKVEPKMREKSSFATVIEKRRKTKILKTVEE